MTQLYVVQMHGEPGAGKSTLARAIGAALPAVVIDKDIISSALLKGGLARGSVGPASYEALWDLASSVLSQGYSVVIDSPAFWVSIQQRGPGIARRHGARYRMVEVFVDDTSEVERRLAAREGLESHPRLRAELPPGTAEPTCDRLRLDGTRPPAELAAEAVAYICGTGLTAAPLRDRATDWPGRPERAAANRGIWSGHP